MSIGFKLAMTLEKAYAPFFALKALQKCYIKLVLLSIFYHIIPRLQSHRGSLRCQFVSDVFIHEPDILYETGSNRRNNMATLCKENH